MYRIAFLLISLAAAHFSPPEGWEVSSSSDFEFQAVKKTKAMIQPNANLVCEPFSGTVEEYIALVEEHNANYHASHLHSIVMERQGAIQTEAGPAKMVKLNAITPLGKATFFQAFLVRDGCAYTITTGSSNECFFHHTSDFVRLIRSFSIDHTE